MEQVPDLYVLCPVKDGIKYLDRYLTSLTPLGCNIVFLDQNSSDGTTQYLEKVSSVQSNVHYFKNTSEVWDHGENTSILLDLCKNFHPKWVMTLDVDETIHEIHRIPSLCHGVEAGIMYSFNRVNMSSETTYWPGVLVVERLFKYALDQTISLRGLHQGCKPDQIGTVKNSGITILHWNMITEEDRKYRYDKFMEADPNCEQQSTYTNLLEVPPFDLPL